MPFHHTKTQISSTENDENKDYAVCRYKNWDLGNGNKSHTIKF